MISSLKFNSINTECDLQKELPSKIDIVDIEKEGSLATNKLYSLADVNYDAEHTLLPEHQHLFKAKVLLYDNPKHLLQYMHKDFKFLTIDLPEEVRRHELCSVIPGVYSLLAVKPEWIVTDRTNILGVPSE